MILNQLEVLRSAISQRASLYHIHDPDLLPIGLALSLSGRAVVRDVHEDLPREIQIKSWIPRSLKAPLSGILELLEAITVPAFDAIVVATKGIGDRFPSDRTVIVRNLPRLEVFEKAQVLYSDRPKHVTYAGLITEDRGACTLESAMELVGEAIDATLLVAGRFGDETLKDHLRHYPESPLVRYVGDLDPSKIPDLLGRQSRIGIALYAEKEAYVDALPTKIFEYMAAGLPIVASDIGGWSHLVRSEMCGILVDPYDASEVAEAIVFLLTRPEEAAAMGRRGRQAVAARWGWETQRQALLDLYDRLVPDVQRPRAQRDYGPSGGGGANTDACRTEENPT